jgi:hypothetical protein
MEGQLTNLFEVGDAYKALHAIAVLNKPIVSLENEEFAVAVLQHDKSPSSCESTDFLWFKVKSVSSEVNFASGQFRADHIQKHSVGKLKSAYQKRTGVKVNLKHARNPISDSIQMRSLNYMKDSIVVFTASEEGLDQSPSSSGATKTPLQPINTQLSANSNPSTAANDKIPVKSEESYTSPYGVQFPAAAATPSPHLGRNVRSALTQSPSVPIKDENRRLVSQTTRPLTQGLGQNGQCMLLSRRIFLHQV